MNMDLQTAYERIQNSKSPIEEVGTIILETGGQWNPAEAADPSKLFTIHLHQIQGVGIGAAAALDDWRMITSVHVKIFLGISQLQSLVSCFILCCFKLGVLVQNISEAITAFWQNSSMQQCEGFLWMQPRQPIR